VNGECAVLDDRWVRARGGRILHADTAEHVGLITRTLRIDEATWAAVLDRYAERIDSSATTLDRLTAFAHAFRAASPPAVALPSLAELVCSACRAGGVRATLARRSGGGRPPMVYGVCGKCGHGHLLGGAAPSSVYESDGYFQKRGADGVGYDAYEAEQTYREAKGARLLEWITRTAPLCSKTPSLLEVGSGFGFTLGAAAARGWRTIGVDVNPAAASATRRLYGVKTVTATLETALRTGAVAKRAWDVVLYQFVLEHLSDPEIELRHAAEAVAPGGYVVFVVPSMSTFEVDVFGASYRSLRADHRHLFSVASARAYLSAAGLTHVAHETTCSLHLLRGFLEPSALADLYAADRGPDLLVLAQRRL
jgi:SAM-dependent methyltransferase